MALGRTGRIRLAIAASLAGTVALAALASWTGARRDTDRGDAAAGLSADFLAAVPAEAPPLAFTEVAREAGIVVPAAAAPRARLLPEDTGSGLAWGDVDGDGDFDLYVVGFDGPSRLFENTGGGRFRPVPDAGGAADPAGRGMGATFADYDGDGDLDLHVTRDGPDRLYRNRGDGAFEEVAAAAGVADPGWSTGAAWGDFDRDGHLDLYVSRYVDFDARGTPGGGASAAAGGGAGPWAAVPYTLNPNSFDPLPNRLFRNRGDGGAEETATFEEIALPSGAADPDGRGLTVTACDLDGDGWLDLYVNNDVSPNALLRNLGGEGLPGLFDSVAAATGTADPRGSMGLSVADL
ncbi:MAG TPA: VCBS repeat-containing protein, partial [Thermoanaerobaculia bacterium]